MNCQEAQQYILQGELGFDLKRGTREALSEHLKDCRACREQLSSEQAFSAEVQEHVRAQAEGSETLAEKIASSLPPRVEHSARSFGVLHAVAAVLLFALGLCVGAQLRRPEKTQAPPEASESTPSVAFQPMWISGKDRVAQRAFPGSHVETRGRRTFRLIMPQEKDMLIEVDYQSTVQDFLTGPDVR